MSVSALYLHVPFCVRRCRYCDFATAATRHDDPLMARYAASLVRLVGQAADAGLLEGVRTAYVGGGTPTMLGASGLAVLLGVASVLGVGELSFEANPESLTDEVLAAACEAGATRVSIGVQSYNDVELAGLGRVHDAQTARQRVAAAVGSGLRTSLDLMCGIPYQTPQSWEESLRMAVELGVGHVSCYPLMIEEGTPLERMCEAGEVPWPSDDTEAADMETAERVLGQAGFSRYEVASYALPGRRCEHNIAYWTGVEYLGLGTAAASMFGRGGYERLRELVPALPEPYEDSERFRLTVTNDTRAIAAAESLADLAFEVEQLTGREAVAEDLMLVARMTDGISSELQQRAKAVLGDERVQERFSQLEARGLLDHKGSALVPTHAGWLLGNELYGPLWDLADED